MKSTKNHYHNKQAYILLNKRDGKIRDNSGFEKDCTVSPGALVELLESATPSHSHPPGKFRFRSLDTPDAYFSCLLSEVSVLEPFIFYLLIPIQSLKDRHHAFIDKNLLNDGMLLQDGDAVFVRLKYLASSELEGIIRYKGPIDETNGIYFGVELRESKGMGDGSHGNVQYFKCPSGRAAFVSLNRLRRSREDWQKNDLFRAGDLQVSDSAQLQVQIEDKKPSSIGVSSYQPDMEGLNLKLGDKVIWPSDKGNEKGTVRWIGVLPDEPRPGAITIGVQFDNPVGTGTGKYKDQRLFYTPQGHASLIPPMGLMKANELEQSSRDRIFVDQQKLLNEWQRNKSLSHGNPPSHVSTSKPNVNKSLPTQFNHQYQGYMGSEGGASAHPMTAPNFQRPVRSTSPSIPSNGHVTEPGLGGHVTEPSLGVGSMVEVKTKVPLYGVIKWIGYLDNNNTRLIAGLELENEHSGGTDGLFKNVQLFHCRPGRALFVPLKNCVQDKRFLQTSDPNPGFLAIESPESPNVEGDIPTPEINSYNLQDICGKNRGIQGHHNSCYLDSTLFSMFYFTTVFDFIFNRPPTPNDLTEYTEVQKVLKEGIVNPLRKHNYVASNNVWKLRALLDKLGTVEGMLGEEKDVEEFLSALLSQIMKADPLLHLSTGEHAYFYQLFMEKDENLLLPSTQKLVELSFLQGNVKLKEVPACLMIQMPRFGKDFKMFKRIVPSLELDITDILENSPRDCIVCGDLATWECKQCYQVHGQGLNTTAFCDKCRIKSHQHASRKDHRPMPIQTGAYFPYFQKQREEGNEEIPSLPREKMELFAVICIQTSHYVSFVKCGSGEDAPWVFFDSMADRIGEQGGFNVPQVTPVPDMTSWLSERNLGHLNKDGDKELPEHLRRLLCDGYMCMYQSPDVMMFQ